VITNATGSQGPDSGELELLDGSLAALALNYRKLQVNLNGKRWQKPTGQREPGDGGALVGKAPPESPRLPESLSQSISCFDRKEPVDHNLPGPAALPF
jgi:hypothetical protein